MLQQKSRAPRNELGARKTTARKAERQYVVVPELYALAQLAPALFWAQTIWKYVVARCRPLSV